MGILLGNVSLMSDTQQSNWNQFDENSADFIKNKPFGIIDYNIESINWSWENINENEPIILINEYSAYAEGYYISNYVIEAPEDLLGLQCLMKVTTNAGQYESDFSIILSEENFITNEDYTAVLYHSLSENSSSKYYYGDRLGYILATTKDNAELEIFSPEGGVSNIATIPKAGIYLIKYSTNGSWGTRGYCQSVSGDIKTPIIKTIDKKYFPEEVVNSFEKAKTYTNEVIVTKADKTYVDTKIADLVNSAPETLDTLGELATALQENEEIVNVLNEAIINKADKTDLVGKKVSNGEVFNDYTNNTATGDYSHAEGYKTNAKGLSSHAEGGTYGASSSKPEGLTHTLTASDYPTFLTEDVTIYGSIANGNNSHAEGGGTYAHGEGSHAEGNFTLAMNYGSHSEGYGTQATGYVSHAEGYETKATQWAAHAEGNQTKATAQSAHAEGNYTEASGDYAHAEGHYSKASGYQSHAEGSNTKATASCAHAEGYYTEAAYYSHSEGGYTKALGNYSHAEGYNSQANGEAAHAEGQNSQANGMYSHTEGYQTKATTYGAHAEGYESEASGSYAHAEGFDTQASGFVTHAEGCYTRAIGQYSHAEGEGTVASGESQHVQGKYNIEDTENKYAHIVGNGTSNNGEQENPSNAHTLDWEGNAWFAGKVFVGGTSMEDATELGSGGSKLVSYNETNVATANQTEFIIDLISFDASVDTVEVYSGRTRLSPSLDYTINGNIVTLSEGLPEGRTLDIRILKNVVTPKEEVLIQGSQIAPGSIPLDRLAESIQLDKVFIRHDTTGELYRIGLDDNGLYTVKQSEQ